MYIIKKHCEATEKNTNFYGTKSASQNWICGKGGFSVKEELYNKNPKFHNEQLAYKTKYSAMNGLKACKDMCEWENSMGYWNTSCELEEINC